MPRNKQKNYYEILGLNPRKAAKISQKEIKAAYHTKALSLHPDKTAGKTEEEFKELNEAYETLKNEDQRYIYDHPHFSFIRIDTGHSTPEEKNAEILRKKNLNEAYDKLSGLSGLTNKVLSLGLVLTLDALVIAGGVLATALAALLYLPMLGVLCCKQELILKPLLGKDKLAGSIGVKMVLGLIVAPLFIAALPFIVLGCALTLSPETYKEQAVRGTSGRGKLILAVLALSLTAGLLVACPPAGAASLFAAGGTIASTLGMTSLSTGAFALSLSSMVGAATGVLGYLGSKIKDKVSSCFTTVSQFFSRFKKAKAELDQDKVIVKYGARVGVSDRSLVVPLNANKASPTPNLEGGEAVKRKRVNVNVATKTAQQSFFKPAVADRTDQKKNGPVSPLTPPLRPF